MRNCNQQCFRWEISATSALSECRFNPYHAVYVRCLVMVVLCTKLIYTFFFLLRVPVSAVFFDCVGEGQVGDFLYEAVRSSLCLKI